ncbi:MAG: DGQHR domain-containing protein [Dehalococcoidia bacterium]
MGEDLITVPVVRHHQKGRVCYTGHMTAEQSAEITFADHYPPEPSERRLGYQRPPDQRRARLFGEYLLLDEAGFMTPILLNARGKLEFVPSAERSNIGILRIPRRRFIAKVDGQHRGIGVEQHAGDPLFPVPFMMFEDLDTELEQRLFIKINREQKKVSMSHVYFVDREEDEFSELVTRLESDPKSPWFHKINLIGARGLGRSVSLQSLREGLVDLFSSGQVKALTTEERYWIALNFWQVVSEVWRDAWNNPRKNLITKSIGMIALSKLGGDLLPQSLNGRGSDPTQILDVHKMRAYLDKASSIDWASDGDFKGVAGRGGANHVKDILDKMIFVRD